MFKKRYRVYLILIAAACLLVSFLPYKNIVSYIKYELSSKKDLKVMLNLVNPQVAMLSADPSNHLALRVEVRDLTGTAVPNAHIRFAVSEGMGEVYPTDIRTNSFGQSLTDYIPPALNVEGLKKDNASVKITAAIFGTDASSSVTVSLKKVPVVYVHGYLANGSIFDTMKEYLSKNSYEGNALNYKSEEGVAAGAKELESFLREQKKQYLGKGMQVNKFDIIAHSMGGLVARYYTCSEDYIRNSNVNKLIFLSVPHRGSPWASIGQNYYTDNGIKDLIPDSPLFSNAFPEMINKGLSSSIQVGNIAVEYDEVVSPESSSLEEWGIETEVFNVGESNFTMDSLLDGSIMQAANHKKVLSNKKVFEKIHSMLDSQLPYPIDKK